MKWLLLVPGLIILAGLVLLVLGLLQPIKHSVTRSIRLKQKPLDVFAALDDSANLPNWSSSVLKVEALPDRDGKKVAQCTLRWGGMKMIMTQLERTPPTRLVGSMAKEDGTVLGTWTYQIAPEPDGCSVSITESGELKNPIFRAIARLRGLDGNIIQTLRDLSKKFGEPADMR